MRAQELFTSPVVGELRELPSRLAEALRLFPGRLRSPVFWQVQGMVGVVTLSHYLTEATISHDLPYGNLHHIPVMLYVFPIIYAGLRFRLEGGLLTALWCGLLTVPNIILWHRHSLDWLVELVHGSVGLTVGLVVSWLVEHEAAERRRAQEMAARLTLVNQQITCAQEDERRRIARELHDEAAQSLVLLCRGLDRVAGTARVPRAALGPLQDLRATAEGALDSLRRFSRDLRPSMLDDLGLVAAVQWLTAELTKRRGVDARVEVTGSQQRLPPEVELALFRIVQEALRNVEKHSEASQVTVDMAFEDGRLRVSVRDNGKGFELPPSMNDLVAGGKLGLVGMQERAQLLGGTLELQAQLGKGTCVTVTLNC